MIPYFRQVLSAGGYLRNVVMRLRAFALLGAVVLGGYASSSDKITIMGVQAPSPEQFVRSELETAAQLE